MPAKTASTWSAPTACCPASLAKLLETALEVEMTEELGYERHVRTDSANTRNGTSPKTLQTDMGPVTINVPRDRNGDFDPVTVPKHSRRLSGFDDQVISLYAKGFTTGDIVDHVADIYGSQVSKDLVTKVTDAVLGELVEWQARPLDPGRSMQWCSSTPSTSRSATVRCGTGRSMWPWASTWPTEGLRSLIWGLFNEWRLTGNGDETRRNERALSAARLLAPALR